MSGRIKVAVGASSFSEISQKPMELLLAHNIQVIKNPYGRKMTEEEIVAHLEGVTGLLAGLEPLNENVFKNSPKLKAISRIGIGMDNVDIESAKRHGIKVSNTPDGPTEAVAEMTLSALLMLLHRIPESNSDIHNGIWKKRMGKSINGLKVLIIGYGRIGRKTAELINSLGAEILIYDKYNKEISTVSLEEGLKKADAISLHISGNEEVIGKYELKLIKRDAIILNSARGKVINERAFFDWLNSNPDARFWSDALWEEPYNGKICECRNAILTPHICTYNAQCREKMELEATVNLLRDLGIED